MAHDQKELAAARRLYRRAQAIMDGQDRQDPNAVLMATSAWEAIGRRALEILREEFDLKSASGYGFGDPWPALSELTMALRRQAGREDTRLLYESGELHNALMPFGPHNLLRVRYELPSGERMASVQIGVEGEGQFYEKAKAHQEGVEKMGGAVKRGDKWLSMEGHRTPARPYMIPLSQWPQDKLRELTRLYRDGIDRIYDYLRYSAT
jgi:hypothetical protein